MRRRDMRQVAAATCAKSPPRRAPSRHRDVHQVAAASTGAETTLHVDRHPALTIAAYIAPHATTSSESAPL
jgi:hypothetical protein